MNGGPRFVLVERRGHHEREIADADTLEEIAEIAQAKTGSRRPADD